MLKVLKAGFFTTIQDQGRFGYLNKGVPVSGFMDAYSANLTNQLVENSSEAAVMEITMTGPTLEFDAPSYICAGGAQISLTLNNQPIEHYSVYKVEKGDILSYGKLEKGFRSYLAIKGGFKTDSILGSQSFYMPITKRNCLKDGLELDYEPTTSFDPKISEIKPASLLDESKLQVTKGPEFELLSDKHFEVLFFKGFKIAKENNRMAYQLEENIQGHKISMLTSATLPGTVQLTPSGKLIILMRDGQTTGGYPRILQLSDSAISILAQKKSNDSITFKLNSSK